MRACYTRAIVPWLDSLLPVSVQGRPTVVDDVKRSLSGAPTSTTAIRRSGARTALPALSSGFGICLPLTNCSGKAVVPEEEVQTDVAHFHLPSGRVIGCVGEHPPLERLHQHGM